MKITGWHIDGFGVLSDSMIDGLPPGLTVMHGPNEAGKSTLLAFIRGVLFGYPTGNTKELKYPPLRGGAHGGRIFLQNADGQWTIARTPGRKPPSITRPDGSAGTSADLDRLVGHATKPLFKSVFAFSLSELQEFSSLEDADVREKVFAAGITGVGTSARQAISMLDARAAELWKPRSSSPLFDLPQEIEELDAQLLEARRQLEAHGQLVLDEATQTEAIEDLRRRIEDVDKRQGRLSLLQQLWPIWDRRQRSLARLEDLPDTSGFPEDGDRRLAAARQAVRSAIGELDVCTEKHDRLTAERKTLVGDDDLAEMARQLEVLNSEIALHRTGLQQHGAKQTEVAAARQRFDEALRELGPDWDEARLSELNTSIPRREQVREWQARLDRAEKLQADAAHKAANADATAAAALDEVSKLTRDLDELGAPPSIVTLDELAQIGGQLRAALADLGRLEERVAGALARAEDAERQAHAERPPIPAFDPAVIGRRLKWISMAAMPIAVALGVIGQPVAAGLAVIVAVVTAAIAVRVAAGRRRQETMASADAEAESPHERAVRARAAADAAQADLDRRQVIALDLARRLGCDRIPRAADLEARLADVEAERRTRDRLDACQKHLEQARQGHQAAAREAATLAAQADEHATAATTAAREWAQWRTAADVKGDLVPTSCLDLFETVRRARDLMLARDRHDQDLDDLEEDLRRWEVRARETLARAGRRSDAQRSPLPDDVITACRAAQHDAERRQRAKVLDDQLAELEAQIKRQETVRDDGQTAIAAVLREARVTSADDFAARLRDHTDRVEHMQLLETTNIGLREKLGSDDPAHPVLVEVATGDVEGWAADDKAAGAERQQLERERDTAIEARSKIEVRRADLEKSVDVPRWEAERAEKLTELQRAADEWRVIQVARQLITDTLAAYVRERQPAVLKVAGSHFSTVTAGRYTRLGLQSDGATNLEVIDARGSRLALDELSRGTAEQLYLCMRLGLAAEVAERATALPIVMDDVLVNFSPDRAAAMVEVLAEAADGGQQILFFTCHPSTRDLLLKRIGDARLEELAPLAFD